jgi:hypothetical protein
MYTALGKGLPRAHVRPVRGSRAPLVPKRWKHAVMTPTVFRDGQFRFFFFSREEPRIHVHVSHPDGEANFWLAPVVELATQTGLSTHVVNEAQHLVEDHLEEIVDAWNEHFGG